jgi:GNAT superfamily N-acetyltransferase
MSDTSAAQAGSGKPPPGAGIIRLAKSGPLLEELYGAVFEPSFNRDELCELGSIQSLVDREAGDCWLSLDAQGEVLGGLVSEWDPDPGVVLVSWIAARPGGRGKGVGGPLLDAALASWKDRFDPCVILTEIEDPAHHAADEVHGDPVARLAFYRKHGARILDLPYFQAALGAGNNRIDHLFLMVLHVHPRFAGLEPDTVDGKLLRDYIELYQRVCEGAVATDERAMQLWEAIDRPGGVRILP